MTFPSWPPCRMVKLRSPENLRTLVQSCTAWTRCPGAMMCHTAVKEQTVGPNIFNNSVDVNIIWYDSILSCMYVCTNWPYLSITHFSLNFGGTKFCHGGKLRCTWQSHLSNFQQQPLAECITGIPYLSHQWTEVLTFANLEIICVLYTIENSGWPFKVPATYPPRYDAVRNPEFFWIQRHQKKWILGSLFATNWVPRSTPEPNHFSLA